MWVYTVEYIDNRYNRIRDYVLANNEEECMKKFKMHHPNENGHIVDWQRINY